MKKILPPLVVFLVLGLVAWRVAQDPLREHDRQSIEAQFGGERVEPHQAEQLDRELAAYLKAYGQEPEDRWFAARAYFKASMPAQALDAVWGHPALRGDPDTPRRLTGLLLRTAGFGEDRTLDRPLGGADLATLALAEGGDADALRRFDQIAATLPWPEARHLYLCTYLYGTRTLRERMARTLRARGEQEYTVAAAILSAESESYPEQAEDRSLLLEFVAGESRPEARLLWSLACEALGRLGGEEARQVLGAQAERLRGSQDPMDQEDGLLAGVGLVALGDPAADALIAPALQWDQPRPLFLAAYARALAERWRQGDAEAPSRIERAWRESPPPGPSSPRPRLLVELGLRDEILPEAGPLATISKGLTAADALPFDRVLASILELRRGDRSAVPALMDDLRTLLLEMPPDQDQGFLDPFLLSPVYQTARALHLYAGSSDH